MSSVFFPLVKRNGSKQDKKFPSFSSRGGDFDGNSTENKVSNKPETEIYRIHANSIFKIELISRTN